MERIENIAIIGMGALGVLFGNLLAENLGGAAVTFIADDRRIARYRAEGVCCNGKRCDFQFSNGQNPDRPADLLIFGVKSTALNEAIGQVKNLVGPDTVILSMLNGIVSEEEIGAALGQEHPLYCVAQGMDAVKLGNSLTYAHVGRLVIGVPPEEPEKQPMLRRVTELFDRAGLPYTVDPDIRRRLWGKWMLNVGLNQVVTAERGSYGTVQRPGAARERMKAAMREVIALSVLEGINLTETDLNDYIALADTLSPGGMPSMRQDAIERRPTEVALFAGTVLEKARKHGLVVPVNAALYDVIQAIEASYRVV